jgi:hypothetical protein
MGALQLGQTVISVFNDLPQRTQNMDSSPGSDDVVKIIEPRKENVEPLIALMPHSEQFSTLEHKLFIKDWTRKPRRGNGIKIRNKLDQSAEGAQFNSPAHRAGSHSLTRSKPCKGEII